MLIVVTTDIYEAASYSANIVIVPLCGKRIKIKL